MRSRSRPDRGVPVSAVTGEGLDELRAAMVNALDVDPRRDPPAVTNVRHIALLERARTALERARAAASAPEGALPEEFVLTDLQDARAALEEITGRRTPDDVLAQSSSGFALASNWRCAAGRLRIGLWIVSRPTVDGSSATDRA